MALYGSEAWWPGLARITTRRDKKVSTGVGWHTDILDKRILKAVRAALLAWGITPDLALRRESEILQVANFLDQRQTRLAARI